MAARPSTSAVLFGRKLWSWSSSSSSLSSRPSLPPVLPVRGRLPGRFETTIRHQVPGFHRPQSTRARIHPRNTAPQPPSRPVSAHWSFHLPRRSHVLPSHVRRSCTTGGLLLLGLGSSPSSTSPVAAVCAAVAAAGSSTAGIGAQRATIRSLAKPAWRRSLHRSAPDHNQSPGPRRGEGASPKQGNQQDRDPGPQKSDASNALRASTATEETNAGRPLNPGVHGPIAEAHKHAGKASVPDSLANSVSKYLHLPKMPHAPTKEELLAAATGFWERLKVRFKWFSIRSMRPWNADEWGAFLSWLIFGHLVWILLGTTTFFSLIILFINTVFAQETLAKWVGDHLTQSAGLTIVFESAIVPKWKDGVITLHNVFVSRRPGGVESVKKGSSNKAAEAAAARKAGVLPETVMEQDDGNYSQFDLTIDTVNVTLSFAKWWNGRGLLKDVVVRGVRGVVDRTHVRWTGEKLDPLSFRREHSPGDFELDYFKLEDLLVTVYQPRGFRPFSVSIFSCELPQLRRQWMFYDFMSASHMSGAYDGSLFTIHPKRIHDNSGFGHGRDNNDPAWFKKCSRLRIDGLKIDHLNRGVEGLFGMIYEGNIDILANVLFPADPEEGIGKVVAEFYDKMEEAVTSNRYIKMLDKSNRDRLRRGFRGQDAEDTDTAVASNPPTKASVTGSEASESLTLDASPPASSYLVMDLRIHLNNVRAAVPLYNNLQIGYVNQALVRPIVAYINSKHTYIPVTCRIVKRATDFDGAWTMWDCGLMDDVGAEVYDAFARDVEDQHNRVRRFKRVGLWTVSLVVHALLAGVAGELM